MTATPVVLHRRNFDLEVAQYVIILVERSASERWPADWEASR